MIIVLKNKHYRVIIDYIGEGVVLENTFAYDVEPVQHNLKPHYFQDASEAKTFMIKSAYGMLALGYEIAGD